jgi:hypothetical protein
MVQVSSIPYLAFAAINESTRNGELDMEYKKARENYIKAIG